MKPLTVLASLAISTSLFAQQPAARPKVLGVAQMAIYVKDLAKPRQFYEDFLGFAESFAPLRKAASPASVSPSSRSTTTSTSRSSTKPTAARAR
jgi:hypothetical protein